jgi:hypothetical protein
LSEPSTNFELSDVYVDTGTLSNFSGAGVSYSAVFTPTSNIESSATIHVDTNAFTDSSSNSNADGTDSDNTISISIDTLKPYIFSGANGKSIQLGMSQTIEYQLNEASSEFEINDISIVGGSLSNFSSTTSSIYLVSVTPTSTQISIISLNVFNGSYRDAAGNYNEERTDSLRVLTVINSEIIGTSLNDQIVGTNGNDHIETSSGNDTVRAGEGNDEVNGRPSFEKGTPYSANYYTVSLLAYMGGGDDFVFGGDRSDEVFGEDGNDELYGNDDNDYLNGGSGDDYLLGGIGDDTLVGGDGNDTLYDGQGNNQIFGGNGDDVLSGSWNPLGDTGLQSKFFGEAGNDTLYGSKGNDQLVGGSGDDWISGGWDGLGGRADTAFYLGNISQFTITAIRSNSGRFQNKFLVVDRTGNEGTDTILTSVEYLNFNNGKTIVTLNSNGSYTYVTLNSSPTGSVGISGKIQQGEVLTATNTLADEDGVGTLKYQWSSSTDGFNWTSLSTGTTLKLAEAQVGKYLKVSASYTDGIGTSESVTSSNSIAVVNVNDAPTGSVVVDGTAKEGYVLTVSNTLADVDGLGLIKYKWQSSDDGTKWADVGSGSSLQLSQAHVGKLIRAVGYYSDGHGTYESVPSQNTSSIAPLIRTTMNVITVIVAPGVIGKDAVLLRDLIEVMTYKSGGLISQSIGYGGASFQYSQIDPLITVVTRNSDFTTEFTKEINDYLKREANLGYAEAVTLVGVQNIDSTLLKIAGADGNFVG